MEQSLTLELARYAAATTIDAIPSQVRDRAKQVIFDEVASAHFGRRSPAGALAARYAHSFGGSAESRIFGTQLRSSAPYAALANGTAGHGEEVDGAHITGGHPGASIVHAASAIAERQRSTGADLLNAVVLGYDIGVRVVRACGGKFVVRDRHHLNSDLFYALGAAAAAGRLLGQSPERLVHALALATFQTNGLYALYAEERHISKSFCNGQYAFAGASAALMSAVGLEGNNDIVGTQHGLLHAWGASDGQRIVTLGLGTEFEIMGANFKFLNAGYPIHAPMEAAMTLVAEYGLAPAAINVILVGMPGRAMRVVDDRAMHNICVQDMIAAAIVRGGLSLRDLPFPAILDDPAFQALRPRIAVQVDPELEADDPNGRGARVTITATDGRVASLRVDAPRGHSRRGGVTWEDLDKKWLDALPNCDVPAACAVAKRLEQLDDVSEFTRYFTASSAGSPART